MKTHSYVKDYILNTSFHGFRFIVDAECHWTERAFWTICCFLSWIASILLMRASWYDFQNNAISFVVETSYLEWDTHFPSVSVCETDNQNKINAVADRLYGDPHNYNLDEIVKELAYFRGQSFYTIEICGSNDEEAAAACLKGNFSIFSRLVRSKCEEIFHNCSWNAKTFDCCTYFVPIDTELGVCYGINSKQARDEHSPRFELISNRKTGPGTLRIELLGQANIYILDEQEVPSLTSLQTDIMQISPHLHYHRFIGIKEIENQHEVKYVSIEQRKCRFNYESDLNVHRFYSYSACCVQCRKNAQIKTCGCTHHLMPNTPRDLQCGLEGLKCLHKNYNDLAVLKAEWANRTGLVCRCLPSCTEMELSIVKDRKNGIQADLAVVEVTLERLPTERFKRKVVRGKLDLVVSMGGAIALFLGASLLSFVELVYYFTLRPLTSTVTATTKLKRKKTQLPFME